MGVIDEVKQRVDILQVVGQYVKLQKTGRTFRGLCPFHQEKHGSFFVYPERRSWHCFGACSAGGDVFSFIMKKEGLDFGEALRLLAEKAGVTIPDRLQAEAQAKEREGLYQLNKDAAGYFQERLLHSEAGGKAREYALKRGIATKTVLDFQLGYSPNSWEGLKEHLKAKGYPEGELLKAGLVAQTEDGKVHDLFRNKLMFSITDERGRITGFGARVLDDSLPKYLNSPQSPLFDKSGSLYALGKAVPAIREKDEVVIVEGYIDALIAHQYGFNNVVASMGTAITDKQIGLIKRFTRNVKLALDADSAGEEALLRSAALENVLGSEIKVIQIPQGKDPDDVIREDQEAWRKLTGGGTPIIDYIFEMVQKSLDLSKVEGKMRLVDKLAPVIAGIANPVRQSHYLEKLASLARVDARRLGASLNRLKPVSGHLRAETPSIKAARLLTSPLEEYSLALILKYPELKEVAINIPLEYFENSEDREVFSAWQRVGTEGLKEALPPEIWEHLEEITLKDMPEERVDERFSDCLLRLKEKYLRNLEAARAAVLATEAESGGALAELKKLNEEGTTGSEELRKVFIQKARRGTEQRR